MGLLDRFRPQGKQPNRQTPNEQEQTGLSESDRQIMLDAIDKGTPCIPFIPFNALGQSMTKVKGEGLQGYFIAQIPALYEDGTIRYLYKEEFMLWLAIYGHRNEIKEKGRTYFFLGFDQPMEKLPGLEYIDPRIFCQRNHTLYNVEFGEELNFFQFRHAPGLVVTYVRAGHNLKVKRMSVVNFNLVAHLYAENERQDPSAIFQSYEQWKSLLYPTSGDELKKIMHSQARLLKDFFKNPTPQ